MEVASDGTAVPSRKLVRRAKRPADANKIFEGGDVHPTVVRRKQPRIVGDESAEITMSDLPTPSGRSQRSADRRQSVSCARCRIYNWKEHRFAKPAIVKERRPPSTRNDQKKMSAASTSDTFSWNLSLEERRKRDSRSALPTAKTVVVPAPSRRVLRSDHLLENGVVGECVHEESAVPMSIGPSTSEVSCCVTETPGRSVTKASSKPAGVRRRKNGATTANSSAEPTLSLQVGGEEVTRGTGRTNSKRIMGQAAPMPLSRTTREARVRSMGRNNDKEQQRSTASGGRRSEAAVVKGVRSEVLTSARNVEAKEDAEKQCAQNEEKEKRQRSELAKRAMEELMKGQSFAPVEMIVADAISKDPLGFVHSLRDARLLRSLEKLAQLRQLNVSAEEARSLMKQRRKEKKREKREKKKQKRLMKLAANCGVSIEQLEFEMSRDRSDSRASAPGSSPLSLNGSLLGSANTSTPTVLSSAALSNLPGPSPSSYLNVFPRPSFVPDPLDPSRNLAAERTDSSGADTPNADNYSPLTVPSTSVPTSNNHCVGPDHASGFIVNDDQNVNLANENAEKPKQCGDSLKVGKGMEGGTNGSTPEDEEDEQNAIAISHLFPQFDALQQLKLIKMCTDSKVQEVDEQEVVSMVLRPETGPSNKVARTLALIKDKVKEFKEINGMRRAIPGGHTLQESESRLESSDEGIDVGNTAVSDASALEQIRQSAISGSWSIPESAFTASESLDTRMTADLQSSPQAHSNELSGDQFISSFTSNIQEPSTSTHADLSRMSSCITSMADMGFGLQPRMLSILDEPLNPTPADDHPPHRTPAVTLKEVPVDEDEENIYMSEVKVVTDWFNHAPYGANKEAHIRYWEDVRQRVLVADWIRKLQQHRVDEVLLNRCRRRMHRKRDEMEKIEMRRSKSTEAWWPRKLFEHYDGVLDLAGKVMRTADSSFIASDVQLPSVNNASLKVFPLDDDETATLAYFRPGSPLTVSDPTDDYQEHVLAQDLDEATVISKDIVEQMDLGQEDEKARYLPWFKVRRMTPYKSVSAPGSTRPLSQTSNKYSNFAPFPTSMLGSVPSQSGPSTGILPRSVLVSNTSDAVAASSSILKHPASQHFLSNAPAYGFLQPNGCYPPQAVYAGLVTPSIDKLPMPAASHLPLLAPHSSGESVQMGLPPLSTVLDNLQPSGSGLSYVHMSTQAIPGAAVTNPYADLTYSHPSVGAGQAFAGFAASTAPLAANFYDASESTSGSSANNGELQQGSSTNDLMPSDFPGDGTVSGYRRIGGLTKDTVVDEDMEDFFRTVLDECDTRPMAHSQSQSFFDEDVDTLLTMDPLA